MSTKFSIRLMLGLLTAVVAFHLLIMAGIIPYDITWGGRLKNDTEMYVFETASIIINLFLIMILAMKADYIRFKLREKAVNVVLWIFLVIFLLNTVGNMFAKTTFEQTFAVITLLFSVLIWNILRKKKRKDISEETY